MRPACFALVLCLLSGTAAASEPVSIGAGDGATEPARAVARSLAQSPGWDFGLRVGFFVHSNDGLVRSAVGGGGLSATRWLTPAFGLRALYDLYGDRRGVADIYSFQLDHRIGLDAVLRLTVVDPVVVFAGLGPTLGIEQRNHVVFDDDVWVAAAFPAGHVSAGVEAYLPAFTVRFGADVWFHERGVDGGAGLTFVFSWPDD